MKYLLFIVIFVAAIVTAGCVSEKNNDSALTPAPPSSAPPAESGNLKLIGGLPIGVSDEIIEYNGFVFIAHGEYIMVYKLTPYSRVPTLTYNDYQYRLDAGAGSKNTGGIVTERGIVRGLVQDRGYLYTGSGTGITIWDVSDVSTSAPVEIAKLRLGSGLSDSWDIQIDDSGNYLYVALSGVIYIIDVTDKKNPVKVKSFGESKYRFFVDGSYLYIAPANYKNNVSVKIYDITDRINPVLLSSTAFQIANAISAIWVDNNHYAYIAFYKGPIGILDVTDKRAPIKISTGSQSGVVCAMDVKGRGDRIYVSGRYDCGWGGGLYIFNTANRTTLTLMLSPKSKSVPGIGYTEGIALGNGDLVYVAENTYGVAIYNISGRVPGTMDPTNLLYLGGNIDSIVAISKDVLLGGDHNNAIWTFDVSNMSDIKVLDRIYGKGRFNGGIGLSKDKHYAFFPKVMYGGKGGGFLVVDISDPTNLVIVNQTGGQVGTSHGAVMSTDGNTLFTREAIFDVTNPKYPVKKYNGYAYGNYIARPTGNYTIDVGGKSIEVKNVTNLAAPYTEWTTNTSGAGTSVRGSAIAGDTLIVIKSGGGQHIITFDISDLSSIKKLKTKTYGTSGLNLQQVAADPVTHMAYVSGNNGDMRSYNIADPANFYQVDYAKGVGNNYGGFGFDPSTGRIFTGWETGIFIFQPYYDR